MAAERVVPTMTPTEFVRKWGPGGAADRLNERAGAQPHFMDLCALLGVTSPADPDSYCFERGIWGASGGRRFADVWKRGHFGWEYKAPGGNLSKALDQLMLYALPLENPPLLIVSDRHSIQIHTHFTGHPSEKISVTHQEIGNPEKQAQLRSAFLSPEDFTPSKTTEQVTLELAGSFAHIADALRARGETPFRAAHFLTQCVFCCFAEDVGVLPGQVFRRVVQKRQTPINLQRGLASLFAAMNKGDEFGADTIPWFNGGLFNEIDVPRLTADEIELLADVAGMSWASIDPSILGTLFERGLDPGKRRQMGAHYTDAATIERLIDPVVRQPLLTEWDRVKRAISGLLSKRDVFAVRAKGIPSRSPTLKARHGNVRSQSSRAYKQAKDLQSGFMERLQSFRVLDPACGSGNFLFLALKALKDIEHQVNIDSEELGLERQIPVAGPQNVLGIEINEYAAELARATVWIGELQWRKEHGYGWKENPILDSLEQIECRDAVVNQDGGESVWPVADAVVSNPPFLGVSRKRRELGNTYVAALDSLYAPRVPAASDLVCYWFDKAQRAIEGGQLKRAGLVATNSIRSGANRSVLQRICERGRIYAAWADEPWINNGAAVRVSLICFDKNVEGATSLDGQRVHRIHADLTGASDLKGPDLTNAIELAENANCSFQGASKKAKFEIPASLAREWLQLPNPSGRPNSDVIKPWANGFELARGPQHQWIIDFGAEMSEVEAALYEAPFEYVVEHVRPGRRGKADAALREYWWRFGRPRVEMRQAIRTLPRFVATVAHSKHRFFTWLPSSTSPDQALITIARSDDATLGLLHSRFHELWSLLLGSSLEDRPRYTPTTCFETFPFPAGLTPADTAHQCVSTLSNGASIPSGLPEPVCRHACAIAQAAKHLTDRRCCWLYPPEWCERVPEVIPSGLKISPYPVRIVARTGFDRVLAGRTLTNLYNKRPRWLAQAHEALDAAVAAAYGWADYSPTMADEEILRRLLALNLDRARSQSAQRELGLVGLIRERDGQAATAGGVVGRKARQAA